MGRGSRVVGRGARGVEGVEGFFEISDAKC